MRARVRARHAIAGRWTPERTRDATLFERLTVARLSWSGLVRLNGWLEFVGKVATGAWVGVLGATLVGVEWREPLEDAVNAGRPVRSAVVVAILAAILMIVAVRSVIGFARWRIQRELWRRDVVGGNQGVRR